jgi:spermidine synthase
MLAEADTPRGSLSLRRRGEVIELRVNGVFVMDTAETGSEEALARLALEAGAAPSRVLIGGLGLGRTLAATLADEQVEQVTVVELEPDLVAWLRADVVPGGARLLDDPRVEVQVGDVRDAVRDLPAGSVDVVLLDVDNGPDHLVHADNRVLYQRDFVHRLAAALTEDGVLAVWSMSRANELEAILRRIFEDVGTTAHVVRLQERDEAYWILVASRPIASAA